MKKYITLRNLVMLMVISRDLYMATTSPGYTDVINGCIAAFIVVALYPELREIK